MSVRERIRIIRLLEKIEKNPVYAEHLGIKAMEPKLCLDEGASLHGEAPFEKE